jgi:hypothetical protein
MRTHVTPRWIGSVAFAYLYAQERRDYDTQATLTSRLYDATSVVRRGFELGQADLMEAIAARVTAVYPRGSAGLEFRNMETGEVVDPELFTTTEDGRASVWAARVCAAACAGSPDVVEALVEVLLERDDPVAVAKALRMLAMGASAVVSEGQLRMDWHALEAMANGAPPPDYVIECSGADHLGQRVQGPGRCLALSVGDRRVRDEAAFRHVIETGHAITLKEE